MSSAFSLWYPKLPPSDNHIREIKTISVPCGAGSFGKNKSLKHVIGYTKEAENYLKEFQQFFDQNYFAEVQHFVRGHRPEYVYDLEIQLHFSMWDVLNKGWAQKWASDSKPGAKNSHKQGERKAKSPYKRLDTLNRRKLLEDGLAEGLGIDDSLTWEATVLKLIADDDARGPGVSMLLVRANPLHYGVPPEFLE
jgi:Holliday junction resolvase RusA-like endonuclease